MDSWVPVSTYSGFPSSQVRAEITLAPTLGDGMLSTTGEECRQFRPSGQARRLPNLGKLGNDCGPDPCWSASAAFRIRCSRLLLI